MSNDKTKHHLHITIPVELYKRLKQLYPDTGVISSLIRAYLRRLIEGR